MECEIIYDAKKKHLYNLFFIPKVSSDKIVEAISDLSNDAKQYFVFRVIYMVKTLIEYQNNQRVYSRYDLKYLKYTIDSIIDHAFMAGFPIKAFLLIDPIIESYLYIRKFLEEIRAYLKIRCNFYQNSRDVSGYLLPELCRIVTEYLEFDYDYDVKNLLRLRQDKGGVDFIISHIDLNVNRRYTSVWFHQIRDVVNFQRILERICDYFEYPQNALFLPEMVESFKTQFKYFAQLEGGTTCKDLYIEDIHRYLARLRNVEIENSAESWYLLGLNN